MSDFFADKLEELGFCLPEGSTSPSESLVKEFEDRFDLVLPDDYREFLIDHGGCCGLAECPMLEPTPFGTSALIDSFYGFDDDEIGRTTELIEGAPVVIALGGEPMGKMLWLYCEEPYPGHVFVCDHECRSSWSDEVFFKRFPNLAAEIRDYLELRRNGELPEKDEGFEHAYLVARSFSDFIERLRPFDDEAD